MQPLRQNNLSAAIYSESNLILIAVRITKQKSSVVAEDLCEVYLMHTTGNTTWEIKIYSCDATGHAIGWHLKSSLYWRAIYFPSF